VVPDQEDVIASTLARLADAGHRLILTTGGTGLTPSDVTPAATRRVIDREVPGLAELMRAAGLASTPMAALSRGVVGARGSTLIANLPGSPRGALESLAALLPILRHAVDQLAGGDH
jgi:molybdenum cofactor synthesis domain-containing protein